MSESWGDDDEVFADAPGPAAPASQQDWGSDEDEFIDLDQPEPPTPDEIPWYEHIPGAVETGLTFLTGAAGEVVGGLAGIGGAILPGEAGQGADVAASVSDALTYEAGTDAGQAQMQGIGDALAPVAEGIGAVESGLGEAALDLTGSPAVATAAHMIPTAAMELLGLGLLKKTSKAAEMAKRVDPELEAIRGLDDAPQVEMIEPETRSMEDIVKDISKKKAGRLAQDVKPDAQIFGDAEGMGVILNPSHFSTNEAFIAVEQAIKSQPNTALAARELEAIRQLGVKADELITDMDGMLDRSILDETVKGRMTGAIKEMEDNTDIIYKQIDDTIPRATKVNPKTSQRYIDQRMKELGDDAALLAPVERKLYRMMQRDKPPTYNALDTLRRDIGDGYKNKGPFKDEASGVLDQVYSVLINDQQLAADAMGAGEEFAAARKLTQTRKNVEKRAMTMFGRQMEKSILPKLTQAATKLTKGDVSEFSNLMEALPADLRQTAAATMLNDLFTLGARNKQSSLGQGFASAYGMLERNKGAKKTLFKYLPPEGQRRFDALGRVSGGLFRAKAFENTSRTARDILMALNEGSLAERVFRASASGVARSAGWKAGGPYAGAMAADKLDSVIKKTMAKEEAADNLLASAAFENALNKAMEGKVREAEVMLKRSAAWRKWRGYLGEGTRAQLSLQGPIAWLTAQEEQQEPAANVQ